MKLGTINFQLIDFVKLLSKMRGKQKGNKKRKMRAIVRVAEREIMRYK